MIGLTELTGGIACDTYIEWDAEGTHDLFAFLFEVQDQVLTRIMSLTFIYPFL